MNDYLIAKKNLLKAIEYDSTNNDEITKTLIELNEYIAKEKREEQKIFKSFYRNVNYKTMHGEQMKDNKTQLNSVSKDTKENLSGKAQVRMLNLIIEICYAQLDIYERQNNKNEIKKMNEVIIKAKNYLNEVERLSELDFDNPSDKLKAFAEKEKLDLKDPTVQKHFIDLRKKYLEEIDIFHNNNLLMMKEKNEDNKKVISNLKQQKKEKANMNQANQSNEEKPSKKKKKKKHPLNSPQSTFSKKVFIIAFIMISSAVIFKYAIKALINNYYM